MVEKAPQKPKFSEAKIHVGTPFIKCFKYYVDSLNTLKVEDLSKEKFIKKQHDRLEQFFMITESKPQDLSNLLVFQEEHLLYKREACKLASRVSSSDLA